MAKKNVLSTGFFGFFGSFVSLVSLFALATAALLLLPTTLQGRPDSIDPAKMVEYVKKLREIPSPRDAEAFYQLGQWCEGEELGDQAMVCYQRALRIDPDHPAARVALGFRPHGLGWTRGAGARSGLVVKPAAEVETNEKPDNMESDSESTSTGEPEMVARPEAGEPGGENPAKEIDFEDVLARKKLWAEESFTRLGLKLSMSEDQDFVIYTTHEARSSKVRALSTALKKLKSQLLKTIGRPKNQVIWPAKLHFVLMRASTECMRFSEAIDGMRFPENSGYYYGGTSDTGIHIVFDVLPDQQIGYFLGKTALERLNNSDRHVGWWLREGVAILVASSTTEGKADHILDQAILRTAAEIEEDFEAVSIFNVIDGGEPAGGAMERVQAEAITLVMYLLEAGGTSKLHKLVAELKSPQAPAVPDGEDPFFTSRFAAFQESTLTAIYRDKPEKMNEKWKKYVLSKKPDAEKRLKPDPENTPGGRGGPGRPGRSD